jgi:NADPH:quinone reductase
MEWLGKEAHMEAIQVKKPGGAEVLQLEECEKPLCGDNDLLVQIKVAGINFIDIYNRSGLYKPAAYPYTPGKEGSGIVDAVGKNVKDFHVGDRVAFCSPGTGSYAAYIAIPAAEVVPLPDHISFEIAAAAMLQGLTAYYLTHLTFLLKPSHTALIHAGAGGVGLLLIQMAKSIGAKVITTVSTQDKANLVKRFGADEVVIYSQESFLDRTMQITGQRGVDIVYDSVGKTTFDDSLKSLAMRGMLVSYGQSSGVVPPFELSRLSAKSLFLTRPSLVHYAADQHSLNEMAKALFQLIASNQLQITIGQRYPLAEASKAQQNLESRKTVGKSLLIVSE